MTDLRPCPKCGGEAKLLANRALGIWGHYVVCLDCFYKTGMCDTAEEAIASWNEEAIRFMAEMCAKSNQWECYVYSVSIVEEEEE